MREQTLVIVALWVLGACSNESQRSEANNVVAGPPPTGGSASCVDPAGCAGSNATGTATDAGAGGLGTGSGGTGAAGSPVVGGTGGAASGGAGAAGAPPVDACADVCQRIVCGTDAACGVDCGPCPEVTIGFDDLMDDELVTEQYAEWVHISTAPGFQLRTNNAANLLGGSEPNILSGYADDSGQNNVNTDFIFEFTHAVSALRLTAVGINTAPGEKCATLEIEDELAGSVRRDFATKPDDPAAFQSTYSVIDLSELTRVTRFAIVEMDDPFGFGVNDLSFTVHPRPSSGP